MARAAHVPLNVWLNARHVGELRREASGAIHFQYARSWLDWENAFGVSLSLPMREERYTGDRVTAVFDNLLPDAAPIRQRIAERVGAAGTDAWSMLTALGHDCVGALQFLPEGIDPGPAGGTDGRPVSDAEVAALINNLVSAPLGMDEDDDFRISIAGAQEKTALLRKDGHWFKPAGTAATTHILKPQIGRLPNGVDLSNSVENEYLCLALLKAFGVPTANTEIADFGGRRTLVVERFDRHWTSAGRLLRLPQEDCCQALSVPSARKYQKDGGPGLRQIFELLKGSDEPERDITTFLRTSILFWLLGATDGHAKNFSIFLLPGGGYRLTPVYDVLTAQPSVDAHQLQNRQFKLAMSVGKSNHYRISEIMPRHFRQTAQQAGISIKLVDEQLNDLAQHALDVTDSVLQRLRGFPQDLLDSVRQGIAQRRRLIELAAD